MHNDLPQACVALNASPWKQWLCRSKSDLANIAKIYSLFCLPQIVVALHCKPALGRTPQCLGKTQRHLRADRAGSAKNAMQSSGGHRKLGREFASAQIVWFQIDIGNELTGMRRVMHSH